MQKVKYREFTQVVTGFSLTSTTVRTHSVNVRACSVVENNRKLMITMKYHYQ